MKHVPGAVATVILMVVQLTTAAPQELISVPEDRPVGVPTSPQEENPQSVRDVEVPATDLQANGFQANGFVPPAGRIYSPAFSWRRANSDCDAQGWIGPWLMRTAGAPELPAEDMQTQSSGLPAGYAPWWNAYVGRRTGIAAETLPVGFDALVQSALAHSPHVDAVTAEPQIRRTLLVEEQAQFDWRSFLNTTWDDLNDPVGNTLTTGNNSDRYTVQQWSADGGLRRRSDSGG